MTVSAVTLKFWESLAVFTVSTLFAKVSIAPFADFGITLVVVVLFFWVIVFEVVA
jgi:hypothetical protein